MGILAGKTSLRSQFHKLTAAELTAGGGSADQANAAFWFKLNQPTQILYLDNTLTNATDDPVDVNIYLVGPDREPDVTANRLLFNELPGLRTLTYSVGDAPILSFEVGIQFFVSYSDVPTAGVIRAFVWG